MCDWWRWRHATCQYQGNNPYCYLFHMHHNLLYLEFDHDLNTAAKQVFEHIDRLHKMPEAGVLYSACAVYRYVLLLINQPLVLVWTCRATAVSKGLL